MSERTWTVLLPRTIDEAGPESIADFAEFVRIDEVGTTPEDLRRRAGDLDAAIVRRAAFTADVLAAAADLKVISVHGTGYDTVDVDAAAEHGVVVCNAPGVNAQSVAEHALTLCTTLRRDVIGLDRTVRDGEWTTMLHGGATHELAGDTLGLLGCGEIGSRLAVVADAIGMEVVTHDPYVSGEDLPACVERVGKAELFDRADVASLHVPLTDETRNAVSTGELRRLSGEIVNTSRGEVLDADALLEELESGTMAGAALDVFPTEPLPADHPLAGRDDVVLTPHVGASTVEAMRRMSLAAAGNVRTVYEGDLPETTVNADRLRGQV